MEFLVQIDIDLPVDLKTDVRQKMVAAESHRAQELHKSGNLVRLWRVAGRQANCGIWRADSDDELNSVLATLPMYRFMRVHIQPLEPHPNDPAVRL